MGRDRELGGEVRNTEMRRKAEQHRDTGWDEWSWKEPSSPQISPKTEPVSETGCLAAARDIRGGGTHPIPLGCCLQKKHWELSAAAYARTSLKDRGEKQNRRST